MPVIGAASGKRVFPQPLGVESLASNQYSVRPNFCFFESGEAGDCSAVRLCACQGRAGCLTLLDDGRDTRAAGLCMGLFCWGFGCLGIWGLLMFAYFVMTDLLTGLAIGLACGFDCGWVDV